MFSHLYGCGTHKIKYLHSLKSAINQNVLFTYFRFIFYLKKSIREKKVRDRLSSDSSNLNLTQSPILCFFEPFHCYTISLLYLLLIFKDDRSEKKKRNVHIVYIDTISAFPGRPFYSNCPRPHVDQTHTI